MKDQNIIVSGIWFKTLIIVLLLLTVFYLYKIAYPPKQVSSYEVVGYPDEKIEEGFRDLERKNCDIISARRATNGNSYDTKALYEFIIKCPNQSLK